MNLSLIVAVAQNRAIGKNNDLLWHISDDLKRFKQLTLGNPVIMGRNTYCSLPLRPLPKRRNIVLSTNPSFNPQGAEVARSLQQALEMICDEQQPFVIGGASIYEMFLPYVQTLYITHVYAEFEADTFFPEFDTNSFQLSQQSPRFSDPISGLSYDFATYSRTCPCT